MFVVLEGIDNAGKTYQGQIICSLLGKEGYRVEVYKKLHLKILETLKRQLGIAATSSGLENFFDPTLKSKSNSVPSKDVHKKYGEPRSDTLEGFGCVKEGQGADRIVIMDRFIHTVFAYGEAAPWTIQWLRTLPREKLYDIVIYIDITPEEALERAKSTNDVRKYTHDYLDSARKKYQKYLLKGEMIPVNGMQPREDVTRDILATMRSHANWREI